ncbi:MAG: signal peptidase II [Myxococcota bacterium]|nr:signal peptidase II [Myxococcota bacterium]
MTAKFKSFWIAFGSLFLLDQGCKVWVVAHVVPGGRWTFMDGLEPLLSITHARNPGGAFGLLVDWPWGSRLAVFVAVAVLACVAVWIFYRSMAPGERFNAAALGLILGGTAGNLVDRVTRGEVVDYLHLDFGGRGAWPDFNVADLGILLGVGALILELLSLEGASRAGPPPRGDD